jgi:hypothetical protein
MTAFLALNNRGGLKSVGGSTLPAVNDWCLTYAGRDLLQVARTLDSRFSAVNIAARATGNGQLLVREQIFQAGVLIGTIAFRLDPAQQRAHLSWTVLTPAARGTGAFKPMLQNLLLAMRDCRIVRITLVAGLSHGGYVWATYGFLPQTPVEWTRLAGLLRTKLATVAAQLTPEQTALVGQLLASADPLALRAIAAIKVEVTAPAAASSATGPMAGSMAGSMASGPTTLGRYLLLGSEWKGQLELSDGPSMLIYLRRIGLMP